MSQIQPAKVLIVDDRPENIHALRALLSDLDAELYSATGGAEALDLLLDHDSFAVALIDVQMPVMDGFELAELMRGAERSRNIPIIFVTAHRPEEASIFKGYESGGVDFLSKPLDPVILRSKVDVFLELQKQKQQIVELKLRAESASRVKGEFLANVSHEIRTPMTAILGYSEMLRDSMVTPEHLEFLQAIERNASYLGDLIDSILDLSKMEAGKVELQIGAINLQTFLSDLQKAFAPQLSRNKIDFSFHVDASAPQTIVSDIHRLQQIFFNLLGNACKFTKAGEIRIGVSRTDDHMVEFAIEDTGCGMDDAQRARVFKPFTQGDSSTTRRFGGTGLGLTISKRLAELLDGDLAIEWTEPGKGTCFALRVKNMDSPLGLEKASLSTATKISEVEKPLQGLKLLIVDDSEEIRLFFDLLLKRAGAEVVTGEDASAGLSAVANQDFDLVLMDVQMPDMDGMEATRRLRQSGFREPVIALTAEVLEGTAERCLQAGCDAYLTKPVRQQDLINTILSFCRTKTTDTQTGGSKSAGDQFPLTPL